MNRRHLLKLAGGLPLMSTAHAQGSSFRRNRPGDPAWPSPTQWAELDGRVGGQLSRVQSPLDACRAAPTGPECEALFKRLKNPWYIGDTPALTQTSGWADAWTSSPSAYCVAARNAQDVAAAVNFAREHRLRLVVKGGGHSYQGTSCAPDSLLIDLAGPVQALRASSSVVRRNFGVTVLFVIVSIFISIGLADVWDRLATNAPGLAIAIVANAFVGCVLWIASLLFYSERSQVLASERAAPTGLRSIT